VASSVKAVNNKEISEYQGRYNSDELQVTFEAKLWKDKLHLIRKNASPRYLKPLYRDYFQAGNFKVRFERNEGKEIIGFLLDAGRVKNLRFTKQ
jgi:hypothetical protein